MDHLARSDDDLIVAARADPAAFADIYHRHSAAVFRYLVYRTRSTDLAADLTAEVFAAALEASAGYRPNGAPARAWLFGIANHKLADSARRHETGARALRRMGVEPVRFDDDALERVEELADLDRDRGRVEALVADLPPGEREAVLARVVHERSYPEIADALSISRESARKRVSRGLTRLAAWMTVLALATVALASGVGGDGPLAPLFGVKEGDLTLASTDPLPDGERARVGATSASGQRWVFGIYETKDGFCFTPLPAAARRVDGVACSPVRYLRRGVARGGYVALGAGGGGGATSGLVATRPVYGLVPADARSVRARERGGSPRRANLSRPFRLDERSPPVRAFLAIVEGRGDERLTGWTRLIAEVRLRDGRHVRRELRAATGFPLVSRRPLRPAADRVRMRAAERATRWRAVSYRARGGALCTAAAPRSRWLLSPQWLQCVSPLAVIDAFQRAGVVAFSQGEPMRETYERASYTVRGFARGDARAVVVTDQRGRRWAAELSRVWTVASRQKGDLAGVRGALRGRLEPLPRRAAVRMFLVAITSPPGPDAGRGLRVAVRLADGRVLRQP